VLWLEVASCKSYISAKFSSLYGILAKNLFFTQIFSNKNYRENKISRRKEVKVRNREKEERESQIK